MLDAVMKVTFFHKEDERYKDWPGYRADTVLRPAFNLGGLLFSGEIHSDEKEMYFWDKAYTVLVLFFTIDNQETFDMVKNSLHIGVTYPVQLASKVIGKAEMLQFTFSP